MADGGLLRRSACLKCSFTHREQRFLTSTPAGLRALHPWRVIYINRNHLKCELWGSAGFNIYPCFGSLEF